VSAQDREPVAEKENRIAEQNKNKRFKDIYWNYRTDTEYGINDNIFQAS